MSATTISRAEHLQWCKDRALGELAANGPSQAWASMASDMSKHPETADHIALKLGMQMLFAGHLSNHAAMRRFVDGFN